MSAAGGLGLAIATSSKAEFAKRVRGPEMLFDAAVDMSSPLRVRRISISKSKRQHETASWTRERRDDGSSNTRAHLNFRHLHVESDKGAEDGQARIGALVLVSCMFHPLRGGINKVYLGESAELECANKISNSPMRKTPSALKSQIVGGQVYPA